MKIAVVEFAGRGGLIHYDYQLCRAFADAGVDTALITDRRYELDALPHPFTLTKLLNLWDPKPAQQRRAATSELYRKLRRVVRAVRYYAAWWQLVRHLRRERPDIVQFGDIRFAADLLFLYLLKLTGLRLVNICHNVAPLAFGGHAAGTFRQGAATRFIYRHIYRCFDRIFTHEDINRGRFIEFYDIDPLRVAAIPHGNELIFEELRDPAVSEQTLRQRLGLGANDKVILLLGSLAEYKGIDILIRAFGRIHRQQPAARLYIVGFPISGFDVAAHQALIESQGIAAVTRILPVYVPAGEIAAWMRLAAIAVFPYRDISQSGALLLAQTFGVPTIAARVGSMEKVVRDGTTGLLINPGDDAALADALLKLLRDPEGARLLGENAAKQSTEDYDWANVARSLIDTYSGLIT